MFVYENNGEFIDVYSLEPKLEEIKNYKMQEMIKKDNKVFVGRSFYYFDENYCDGKIAKCQHVLEGKFDTISSKKLENFSGHYGRIHEFGYIKDDSESSKYWLKKYYENENFDYRISRVKGYSNLKYMVLLNREYDLNNVMHGIIDIPESLYLLEAILKNRFDLIGNKDITEQLQLFNIKYYGRVNVNVIQNICEYQLLPCTYETIMKRMEDNKNALVMVRKLAK